MLNVLCVKQRRVPAYNLLGHILQTSRVPYCYYKLVTNVKVVWYTTAFSQSAFRAWTRVIIVNKSLLCITIDQYTEFKWWKLDNVQGRRIYKSEREPLGWEKNPWMFCYFLSIVLFVWSQMLRWQTVINLPFVRLPCHFNKQRLQTKIWGYDCNSTSPWFA